MQEITNPSAYEITHTEASTIAPYEEVCAGRGHCMERWLDGVQNLALDAFVNRVTGDAPASSIHPNLSSFSAEDTICLRDARTVMGVAGEIVNYRNEALII